jgi:uracil-DNA glycosylase family 4
VDDLASRITACPACPGWWRGELARERRAAPPTRSKGRPVPDSATLPRTCSWSLAPAAHGANRTGRMFTGDRSGDWLFRALHRAGFASRPESVARDDGLRLRDCWVTAAVRCAPPDNRPTRSERDACRHWLVEEMERLDRVSVIVCLGGFAWTTVLGMAAASGLVLPRPRPRFAHGSRCVPKGAIVGARPRYCSPLSPQPAEHLHGRLTEAMLTRSSPPCPASWTILGSGPRRDSMRLRRAVYSQLHRSICPPKRRPA